MSFRSSASFGKGEEYAAIAELLRRGHDVYMTLVDDQGIDCVIPGDSPRRSRRTQRVLISKSYPAETDSSGHDAVLFVSLKKEYRRSSFVAFVSFVAHESSGLAGKVFFCFGLTYGTTPAIIRLSDIDKMSPYVSSDYHG